MLTEMALRQYQEQGYYAPIRVMPRQDADALRARLEAFEAGAGPMAGKLRHKSHLLFTWLNDLVRHPRILDAVEDVIGPNILCWGSSFFIKEPRNPGFVSWHQDSTYWGLDPADVVTAWVALSDSIAANGAMRVIPGIHKLDQVPHHDTFRPENLLSRGQEIMVDVDASQAEMLELQRGRDVAAPCAADPRLRSQSLGPAAHRLRHPLHPDLRPPGRRRARPRDPGARRRYL